MARELQVAGRRYWVLSEPTDYGWKAWIVEVRPDGEGTDPVGIEAAAETRSAADMLAEQKLRRLLALADGAAGRGEPDEPTGRTR